MPYIKQEDRNRIAVRSDVDTKLSINVDEIQTVGDLNYAITEMMLHILNKQGESYTHMNNLMGAVIAAKDEFYRRKVAPYEDQKIKENGDVY